MSILYFVIGAIVGLIIGETLTKATESNGIVGTLRVDRSEPHEEPRIFLELKGDVAFLERHKVVKLNIKNENYISR